jgi:hypothetical protein
MATTAAADTRITPAPRVGTVLVTIDLDAGAIARLVALG